MLVGFAEGLGAAKTYAAREHYEIDANRELLGLGAANLGSGLSSGMVVNGSLSKTAVNGRRGRRLAAVRPRRRRADRRHAAVPHRPVREAARGDAGGGRDRGGDRARRRRARSSSSTASTRAALGRIYGVAARPDFIAARRGAARRARLRHAARACSSASRSRCCCCSTARRGRTSPCSASVPGDAGQYGDVDRHPDERVAARASSSCASRAACSSPTPTRCARVIRAARRRGHDGGRARRRDDPVRSTSRAPRCSRELAADLRRDGIELVLARDVGSVQDLLRLGPDGEAIRTYPTVRAAIAAIGAGDAAAPEG